MPIEASFEKQLGKAFHLDVTLSADSGGLAIMGASGSGKSITLKCLAGIETPDSGHISLCGKDLFCSNKNVNVRPQLRRIGMMFQNYALFPSMTVAENIAVGVSGSGREKARIVAGYIRRFSLKGVEKLFPGQLSGGQQQRVALARMLAAEPEAVLLDEPFSALDLHLREKVRLDILEAVRDRVRFILVTHSFEDAFMLCKSMLVLDRGRMLALGTPDEVYRNPGHVRVAELTGCENISRLERISSHRIHAADWGIVLESDRPVPESATCVGIRARDIEPVGQGGLSGREGRVNHILPCIRSVSESPAGKSILFSPTLPDGCHSAGEMWWKVDGRQYSGIPSELIVPPSALVFLGGEL